MAVRQTVVASNPARQNLADLVRGRGGWGDLVQVGADLVRVALCGIAVGTEVRLSQSIVNHEEFTTLFNITDNAWNCGKSSVTQLKKCAPISIRLRFVLGNGNSQLVFRKLTTSIKKRLLQ